MFNFKNLIKKFSKSLVTLIRKGEGYFDYTQGGKWVEGEEEQIPLPNSAVVPLSNSDLKHDEGGAYTTEDRKLYTHTDIKLGEKINHKDKEYTVQERKDYSDFDEGLYIYFMKRVGD